MIAVSHLPAFDALAVAPEMTTVANSATSHTAAVIPEVQAAFRGQQLLLPRQVDAHLIHHQLDAGLGIQMQLENVFPQRVSRWEIGLAFRAHIPVCHIVLSLADVCRRLGRHGVLMDRTLTGPVDSLPRHFRLGGPSRSHFTPARTS